MGGIWITEMDLERLCELVRVARCREPDQAGLKALAAELDRTSIVSAKRVPRDVITMDSLETATRELLAGSQQDFPVVANGKVAGLVRRNDLVQALAQEQRKASVEDVMCRKCGVITTLDPLN